VRALHAAALAFFLFSSTGCAELVGNMKPVPAVHRVPIEVEGTRVLVAEDPVIESNDPVHLARAKQARVPQDYRASMTNALMLAGFKVVTSASEPHDLVAKLALAVREESGKVYQTYRCGLRAPDGTLVAQIDWAWPQGTYVDETEVYDYATHSVATEIVMSARVLTYLRARKATPPAPAPAPPPP
jgi:hypothetical protein